MLQFSGKQYHVDIDKAIIIALCMVKKICNCFKVYKKINPCNTLAYKFVQESLSSEPL